MSCDLLVYTSIFQNKFRDVFRLSREEGGGGGG